MAKELYYFQLRNSNEPELIEAVDSWLEKRYDYDTIRDLMWIYHNDVAIIADGVEVSWDYEIEDYSLKEGNSLSSYHFSKEDLEAHGVLTKCKEQDAFEDYVNNCSANLYDRHLLKLINLSDYDVYYIITA